MRPTGTPPAALTIAATDSGGGAGLAADLRTFAAHGVHGTLAVTAVTAQHTSRVKRVFAVPSDVLAAQLEAVLADLAPEAAKTGMFGTVSNATAVAERAAAGMLPSLVVDPVLVSSSSRPLFPAPEHEQMLAVYRKLARSATVLTPNLPEAALLAGRDPAELAERAGTSSLEELARMLHSLGSSLVVVKGGRLARQDKSEPAIDVAFDGVAVTHIESTFVASGNVHGTGDGLSAAIAARLAWGHDALQAVIGAKRYVAGAVGRSAGWQLGAGHGPIDNLSLWKRREETEMNPGDEKRNLST